MNKRQAKKAGRNNILLCGITYRKNREILRQHEVYVTKTKQAHSVFRGFNEEEQFLIEIGIYTEDEVRRMYYGKGIEKETIKRFNVEINELIQCLFVSFC